MLTGNIGGGLKSPSDNRRAVRGWAAGFAADGGGTHSNPEHFSKLGEILPGGSQMRHHWGNNSSLSRERTGEHTDGDCELIGI